MGLRGIKPKYKKRLCVRVTDEELEQLEIRASMANLSMSRFLVEAGLCPKLIIDPQERERQKGAVYQVRKIGGLLNQIARALNKGEVINLVTLERVLEQQEKTLEALEKLVVSKS